jgi:hypothetical protein
MRDAAKKTDTSWDDLKGIYQSCIEGIQEIERNTVKLYQTPHLTDFLEDRVQTAITLRGLQRDLNTFTAEVNAIYKNHSERSGGVTDENDLVATFRIFELYNTFNSRFGAVTLPAVVFLNEQAEKAAKAIDVFVKAQEAQDLTNPNVVSDVVAKEYTAEQTINTSV